MKAIDEKILKQALTLLEERLRMMKCSKYRIIVCGGSALIAAKLVPRTTKDIDIVALIDNNNQLLDPEPLPEILLKSAEIVADMLRLPKDWFNCGPVDLFRMGLPEGLKERLIEYVAGPCLTIYFISRIDQIYFKLYASVDRGGYHINDLLALNPTTEELVKAGHWTMTHDVSDGYRMMLRKLLKEIGYAEASEKL